MYDVSNNTALHLIMYMYVMLLVVMLVCDLWLLWDSHKTSKELEQLERNCRFANIREVEHQFLK